MIIFLSLILSISSTCTTKTNITNLWDNDSPLLLEMVFEDNSLLDLVQSVALTVSLSDEDIYLEKELTIQNGEIKDQIEVPAGDSWIFTLEALDSSKNPIYRGSTIASVVGGQTNQVNIKLSPVVFLLKLDPVYQKISNSEPFVLEVKLYNVEDLFGISFRVEFDTASLICTEVSSGDFLGSSDSTIFFSKADTLKGYVAVGYSKIQGNGSGVSGDGVLARIYFRAKEVPGENPFGVNLVFNTETLCFYDPAGERPEWKDSLYIHNAQIWLQSSIQRLGYSGR